MHWKGNNIIYTILLPEVHNLNQMMRKQSEKPSLWGLFYKTTNLFLFFFKQMLKSWKQRKAEELFQIKRDGQLHAVSSLDPELGHKEKV